MGRVFGEGAVGSTGSALNRSHLPQLLWLADTETGGFYVPAVTAEALMPVSETAPGTDP
jgi:hypothetical protein